MSCTHGSGVASLFQAALNEQVGSCVALEEIFPVAARFAQRSNPTGVSPLAPDGTLAGFGFWGASFQGRSAGADHPWAGRRIPVGDKSLLGERFADKSVCANEQFSNGIELGRFAREL